LLPYAAKIKSSGAQAVITGNWGNDLTLLVKAAREVGFEGKFYTFYGNALGAPAAIGDAGIGRVVAVADWLPNVPGAPSEAFYRSFRARFPKPEDDYVHMRMQLLVEALVQAMEKSGSATNMVAVAGQLEQAAVSLSGQAGRMRAADHQFQQPLVVGCDGPAGRARRQIRRRGLGLRIPGDPPDQPGPGRTAEHMPDGAPGLSGAIPERFTPRAGSGSGYEA
jgi:branched-chain amino acid transport system substrate-binding protein